jgi:hypothetical protein
LNEQLTAVRRWRFIFLLSLQLASFLRNGAKKISQWGKGCVEGQRTKGELGVIKNGSDEESAKTKSQKKAAVKKVTKWEIQKLMECRKRVL